MDWQPIETAPKDGTHIQAEIPGEGSDFIIAWDDGYTDADGYGCGCWVIAADQEPPSCWTDGVCWESNEDEKPSKKPTRWRLPEPPTSSV